VETISPVCCQNARNATLPASVVTAPYTPRSATTVAFSYRLNADSVWTDMPGSYTITGGIVFSSLPARFPYVFLKEVTAEDPFQVSSQHWKDTSNNDIYKAWPRVNDPGKALYSGVSLNSPGYLTETPLDYNSGAGLWSLSGTLFADDFNNNSIDTSKWTTAGNTVTESGGTLNVDTTVGDAGGKVMSRTIPINPYAEIVVQRRAKVYAANNYFNGLFALYFGEAADFASGFNMNAAAMSVVVSHANYDYSKPAPNEEQAVHGFYLGRWGANFPNPSVTSNAITPIWGTWFDEKIVYNPVTGVAKLYINNELQATVTVGALPATARYMNVFVQAWGWYTGHYNYSDDLTVSQPWTGGDILLSTNTPPASDVVFNFTATKQGGGTESVSKTIPAATGYVAAFATNLLPTGNVSGTPTFSWSFESRGISMPTVAKISWMNREQSCAPHRSPHPYGAPSSLNAWSITVRAV
jgi:hypothetical protein